MSPRCCHPDHRKHKDQWIAAVTGYGEQPWGQLNERTERPFLAAFGGRPIHRYPPTLFCAKFAKESGIVAMLAENSTHQPAVKSNIGQIVFEIYNTVGQMLFLQNPGFFFSPPLMLFLLSFSLSPAPLSYILSFFFFIPPIPLTTVEDCSQGNWGDKEKE